MRRTVALVGCALVATLIVGCQKAPDRSSSPDRGLSSQEKQDIDRAEATHRRLREGLGLPVTPAGDPQIRIAEWNEFMGYEESLVAERLPNRRWRVERAWAAAGLPYHGRHGPPKLQAHGVLSVASSQQLDALIADPNLFAKPPEPLCMDPPVAVFERWRGAEHRAIVFDCPYGTIGKIDAILLGTR